MFVRANKMAEITVNINEEEIQKLVTQQIADAMTSEYGSTVRDTKYGVRKGVEMAVKNYIYSNKDDIVERCVERAADGLVRKGLPKLLEAMGKEMTV